VCDIQFCRRGGAKCGTSSLSRAPFRSRGHVQPAGNPLVSWILREMQIPSFGDANSRGHLARPLTSPRPNLPSAPREASPGGAGGSRRSIRNQVPRCGSAWREIRLAFQRRPRTGACYGVSQTRSIDVVEMNRTRSLLRLRGGEERVHELGDAAEHTEDHRRREHGVGRGGANSRYGDGGRAIPPRRLLG
jgi:hypothetical protein